MTHDFVHNGHDRQTSKLIKTLESLIKMHTTRSKTHMEQSDTAASLKRATLSGHEKSKQSILFAGTRVCIQSNSDIEYESIRLKQKKCAGKRN